MNGIDPMRLIVAILFLGIVSFSEAAEFRTSEDRSTISIHGKIESGDYDSFLLSLQNSPSAKKIILNSPGGAVWDALRIANSIRKSGLSTEVPSDAVCLSACFYLAISGNDRTVNGELGVHQIWTPGDNQINAAAIQQILSEIVTYVIEAGIDPWTIPLMLKTPKDGMYVFSRREIQEFGIAKVLEAKIETQKNIRLLEKEKYYIRPKLFSPKRYSAQCRTSIESGNEASTEYTSTELVISSSLSSKGTIIYSFEFPLIEVVSDGNHFRRRYWGQKAYQEFSRNGDLVAIDINFPNLKRGWLDLEKEENMTLGLGAICALNMLQYSAAFGSEVKIGSIEVFNSDFTKKLIEAIVKSNAFNRITNNNKNTQKEIEALITPTIDNIFSQNENFKYIDVNRIEYIGNELNFFFESNHKMADFKHRTEEGEIRISIDEKKTGSFNLETGIISNTSAVSIMKIPDDNNTKLTIRTIVKELNFPIPTPKPN
ncbi:MAG: hypothetical protein ABJP66_00300 [Hyphomicrobiales bacterium]